MYQGNSLYAPVAPAGKSEQSNKTVQLNNALANTTVLTAEIIELVEIANVEPNARTLDLLLKFEGQDDSPFDYLHDMLMHRMKTAPSVEFLAWCVKERKIDFAEKCRSLRSNQNNHNAILPTGGQAPQLKQ